MTKPYKIVCCSPTGTASTVLSNIVHGLIDAERPVDFGNGASDPSKEIVQTHEVDIDKWINDFSDEYDLYFIVSERPKKNKTIQSKYYDYPQVKIFQFDQISTNTNSVEQVVALVYNTLIDFLPEYIKLSKRAAIKRIKQMNKRYEEIKDKPFAFVDSFYHIHGSHKTEHGRPNR